MDSFDPYRHHSDHHLISRPQPQGYQRPPPTQHSTRHQPQQSQQHLPSFKEILAPPSHSAINSNTPVPSQPLVSSETGGTLSQPASRAAGSGLPSPNVSQSSSMPDSFDDFGTRQGVPSFQLQSQQRNPSSWTNSPPYTEMTTTYGSQRPAYQTQGMSVSRPSPGLPPIRDMPIRDINQGYNKYNTYDPTLLPSNGSYSQGYNQQSGQLDVVSYGGRRDPYYNTSERYGQTYPPAGSQYPTGSDYARYPQQFNGRYGDNPYSRHSYGGANYSPGEMNGGQSPITPGSMMDPADNRSRRRRGNLPKHITDILRAWFQDHLDHPYPTEEEKQMFIHQTGLSINQISNWFINARRRQLPAMRSARDQRVKQEAEVMHKSR